MVAAFGRSQKRSGGLRPPPLFWVHILSKYCQNIVNNCPGTIFGQLFDGFEPPEDNFLLIFRGPSQTVVWQYFDNFLTIRRGPSRIHQNQFFANFPEIPEIPHCRGLTHCKPRPHCLLLLCTTSISLDTDVCE